MTVNDIIGRALLAIDEGDGLGPVPLGYEIDGSICMEEGCTKIDAIGAAVVKALDEAGYEIVKKPEELS
jgi:hypothetical protein